MTVLWSYVRRAYLVGLKACGTGRYSIDTGSKEGRKGAAVMEKMAIATA